MKDEIVNAFLLSFTDSGLLDNSYPYYNLNP